MVVKGGKVSAYRARGFALHLLDHEKAMQAGGEKCKRGNKLSEVIEKSIAVA